MLIDQIKKDSLVARKARETDKATLLTTLYSEAFIVGKNSNRETTDAEVIQTVKKFIKGVDENLSRLSKEVENNTNSLGLAVVNNKFEAEKEILSVYLPKQLSEQELTNIITNTIANNGFSGMKDMGKVMGKLKADYDGQFDGSLASKIVRELLG